ncbi:MAG: hypothetical protein E6Q94_11975 [Burkholderiaceae bacterium]|nr:MAG: hypothetical protein E6Q94_11975 [Burkholderiaceae bacterium]
MLSKIRRFPLRSGTTRAAGTDRTFGSAVASASVLSLSLLSPTAAHAVDGCLVLLCFAAPSWKSIPQCVPPIRQVLRDLARGKAFPTCGMSGAGNSARHAWARAPGNCPPQYTRVHETESGPIYTCDYTGAITVSINGKPFTRTWWGMGGDTVTDFSPVAKSQLGSWDTKYDDDRAAWQRSLP